ncbi:glycosyltransferase family 2 protein [Curvivirga sp.]|uniref:glycosyltransferase family 2 protein n=1 Tax=Curvivirga sp. TaxID=2856848 RepID=UPI003B5C906A
MLETIIIILCVFVIYHHAGFPVLLKLLMKKNQITGFMSKSDQSNWPEITLIIPAYNEEKTIEEKIINTASLDYPSNRLKVVIALDGCSDQTANIARNTLLHPEVRQLDITINDHRENRGKVAVLNEEIFGVESDIVALSDCSSLLSLDSLKRVAGHFSDLDVGVVGGTYQFSGNEGSSEQVYWKYQTAVKTGEANFGSPMGLHGAFYAFRKSLAERLPANTINDDFILPMKIIAQGYRGVYDLKISCIETESSDHAMNWKRRVRISAGNVQQAIRCLNLLFCKKIGVSFCFFSGKFLRAWMPLCLLTIFALTAIAALDSSFFQYFFLLQFMGLVFLFLPVSWSGKIEKIISALRYILIGHMAGLVGTFRYLAGLENGAWKRPNQ